MADVLSYSHIGSSQAKQLLHYGKLARHQDYQETDTMDKIPGHSDQTPTESKPATPSTANNKGKLGSKQVSSADAPIFLDKTAATASGQTLGNRQITPHNLDMIALLGQEQRWEALSSAIDLHGKTINDLTRILSMLKQHSIEIPAAHQDQICLRFCELTASVKAVILKSKLPTSPVEELAVLATIAQHPENHDSPIGIISRQEIDGFIKTHNLNSVHREYVVQNMSHSMYSMIVERMKSIEDKLLATSPDATLKKQIQYTQNQRRIEENHRSEVSVEV